MGLPQRKLKNFIITWDRISATSKPEFQIKEIESSNYFTLAIGRNRGVAVITAKSQKETVEYIEVAERELYHM